MFTYGSSGYGLDRVTLMQKAAGTGVEAWTNYAYNSPTWLVTYSDQSTKNDQKLITEQKWDGLGRPSSSYLHESAGAYIQTNTNYDALNRLSSVSNPFGPATRSSTPATRTTDWGGRPK
jgi:hypothetical protein